MRKVLVVSLVVGALALGLLVPRGTSAPALADKPPRYEYGELRYLARLAAPAGMAAPRPAAGIGAFPPPGAPAGPPPAPAPAQPKVLARWSMVSAEVEAASWDDLADKLKAPPGKNDGSPTVHKLRVLTQLSAEGWEMLDHQVPDETTTVWAFRRRVP
jgi:hypothetical protein